MDITIFTEPLVILAAKERILMKSKFSDKKSFNCLKRVKIYQELFKIHSKLMCRELFDCDINQMRESLNVITMS